jgi:hypothetical protein
MASNTKLLDFNTFLIIVSSCSLNWLKLSVT